MYTSRHKSHPDQQKSPANDLLAKDLKTDGYVIYQSESDANILLTSTGLTIARTEPLNVVAGDTGIIILLPRDYNESLHGVCFQSEAGKRKRPVKLSLQH